MQISGHGKADQLATILFGVQEGTPVGAKRSAPSEGGKDRVQLSQRAKAMQQIRALADQPDTDRAERIDRISRALEAGTLNVPGRKVGDAVIRHALIDAVL